MFFDEKIVTLKAGNGGDGCASFRREKYIPLGGPNGGDGGKGGDIILECDNNLNDLTTYHYKPRWEAGKGTAGMGSKCRGPDGADLVLKMPPGTIVYDVETGRKLIEMTEHGQRVTLVEGGKGGLGNVHFKSASNQAPRQFTPGVIVPAREFKLNLKVIADIGLVGFPNAGKSSLINILTQAHPKVAPYPFTTKIPSIGVIEYPEDYSRILLADIPGLIEGASENRGLGHRFLKHVERCKVLLMILDMGSVDQRDPLEDFVQLRKELELFNPELLEKPYFVAANKMDLPEAEENLKRLKEKYSVYVRPISCLDNAGIDELKKDIRTYVRSMQ